MAFFRLARSKPHNLTNASFSRCSVLSLEGNAQSYCTNISGKTDDEFEPKDPRDISRLPRHLKKRLAHNNQPSPVYKERFRNLREQRDALRKSFAMKGKSSEIDPAVLWDTKEEYLEHFARDMHSPSLEEAIREHLQKEQAYVDKRDDAIENVKVRMEVLMPEMFDKKLQEREVRSKKVQRAARMSKKDTLMEEAREYLGYKVTANDPEFRALLEKNKKEEVERKKQERKDRKMAIIRGVAHEEKVDKKTSKETAKEAAD